MHDPFNRAILSDRSIAADYFQAFLPVTVSQHLDFATLTHLPDSYLSEELQKTMSDIVYTCRKKGAKAAVKVSLLIEHKSYPDKYTPIQIGSYIFSALQKQVANKEPLSIVIPVLLYNGKGRWHYLTLAQLFKQVEPEWRQYIPDFSYIYNNLVEVPDEQVAQLNNHFLAASLLALKHAFEKDWLAQNALRVILLAGNAAEQLQHQFMIYFFERSRLKEAEIGRLLKSLPSNYKNNVMSTADYFIKKGKAEGKAEGKEEKSIEFVRNLLLADRFSISEIASLANVTEAFVLQVNGEIQ